MKYILVDEEVIQQLTVEVREMKDALAKSIENNLEETYIESKKIPKILGISSKTWQNYRDNGTVPFIQYGSKIWVKRSDLEVFMNRNYISKNPIN